MTVPLWVLVTLVYVASLVVGFRKTQGSGEMFDFSPLLGCFWALAATVLYLLYWVVVLA